LGARRSAAAAKLRTASKTSAGSNNRDTALRPTRLVVPFSPVDPPPDPDGELPVPPDDGFDEEPDVGVDDSGSVWSPVELCPKLPVDPDESGLELPAGVC
jgi:hypothetical protein